MDRATYPRAEELVQSRGGSLVSKGQRSRKGKTEEGGGDVDVDTKCGVISHVVCALNTLTIKTEIIR